MATPDAVSGKNFGNPSHSPIGKYFPNSKYENVKNKQIQIFIFGTKILDLFDSEHPYLESRKSNIAYMSGGMGVSLFPSDPDQ